MNEIKQGGRFKRATAARLVCVALIIPAAAGCDAGKAPYQEAATLEEQGKSAEAAEKYDAVCRRAPDSKLCPPSIARAASIRVKLAEEGIKAFKFADAEQMLKVAQTSADADSKEKAKTLLSSKDLLEGLRWEKALVAADKRTALKDMETVAASGTPAASKATEWLTKERPPLLLADATAACTATPMTPNCQVVSEQLLKLHPGTPEATKATEFLASFKVVEDARIYPFLMQAEGLMAQCQKEWTKNEAHSKCILRQIAATGDAVIALATCGEADQKTSKKIQEVFDMALASIGTGTPVGTLKSRFKKACDDGEYEKQVPAKPAGLTPADSKSADSGEIRIRCKNGEKAYAYKLGCSCGEGDKAENIEMPGPCSYAAKGDGPYCVFPKDCKFDK